MKLAIVNGSSFLAQGIIKRLAQKELYKEITIIDYFQNNCRFDRVYKCLDKIETKSDIKIRKFENKNSLSENLKNNDHLIYITHDYANSAPCKNKVLENVIEKKDQFKYSLFVNPLEYGKFNNNDNYYENLNNNLNELKLNPKNTCVLNSPVTYGDYSDAINNYLVYYLLNKKSLYIKNNYNEIPLVKSTELFDSIEEIIENKKEGFFNLVSNEKRSIKNIIEILEKTLGGVAILNDFKTNLLRPMETNLINEQFFTSEFMNYMKMFNKLNSFNYDNKNFKKIFVKKPDEKLKNTYSETQDFSLYEKDELPFLNKLINN